MPRAFQIVVAATETGGIGRGGALPWRLPGDMKNFRELTSHTVDPGKRNAVIMGRKTWESIPPKFRPLQGRVNVVLSRDPGYSPGGGAYASPGLDEALEFLAGGGLVSHVENVFVIGGARVYALALVSAHLTTVHLTKIEGDLECDTRMPPIDETVFRPRETSPPVVENGLRYSFVRYERDA
jgi:dihydrofolate reductase/thymidylate synthase